jgi:hypothetical protein
VRGSVQHGIADVGGGKGGGDGALGAGHVRTAGGDIEHAHQVLTIAQLGSMALQQKEKLYINIIVRQKEEKQQKNRTFNTCPSTSNLEIALID